MQHIPDNLKTDLRRVAGLLADAARVETLRYFRNADLGLENKLTQGFDPVTAADRAAEQAMLNVLKLERPQDAVLGEEFGSKDGTSGLQWVLDPIDGTRGYMSGTPTWGTLIAVSDATGPICSIIDQPFIGERFFGGWGAADYVGPLGAASLSTRGTTLLQDATIFTTFPEVGTVEEGAAFKRVANECRLTRYGTDCYAYALLAAGQIDLVIEAGLNAYDIQAPIALVQGAGGIVTNWEGGPAHNGGRAIAAANETIHRNALKLLQA